MEVKHKYAGIRLKGPSCDVKAPKTNLLQKISSTGQDVSESAYG